MTARRDRRRRLLDTCADPDCVFCTLGERLLDTLTACAVDTTTELLTLVRLLAVTAVAASSDPDHRARLIEVVVIQLQDDVARFAGEKEAH